MLPCKGQGQSPFEGQRPEHAFIRNSSTNPAKHSSRDEAPARAKARSFLHHKPNYYDFPNNIYCSAPRGNNRLIEADAGSTEGPSSRGAAGSSSSKSGRPEHMTCIKGAAQYKGSFLPLINTDPQRAVEDKVAVE